MDASDFRRQAGSLLEGLGWQHPPNLSAVEFVDTAEPLATSWPIGGIASAALGALGQALFEIQDARGGAKDGIRVDRRSAAFAMCANDFLRLDGKHPVSWPELSGFYQASDGWVFLHGGFPPHAKRLVAHLGAPNNREELASRVAKMPAQEIEDICVAANTCGRRVRTYDEYAISEAAKAVAQQPVIAVKSLGTSPAEPWTPAENPLQGVRVLDLSRVLAGPTIGRTLAEHGADVLRIASPNLPFIEPLAIDTGYGKRSAHIDLETETGRADLTALIQTADVFIDGYRPGALSRYGLGPQDLDRLRPGIIYLTLSAWGEEGPWAGLRGYDSLVQAAAGLAGGDPPKRLPCQPLDYLTGYLGAFAICRALMTRAETGAGARIDLTLAGMAHWMRQMASELSPTVNPVQKNPAAEDIPEEICELDSEFGRISALRPALDVPWRPRVWTPPVRIGSSPPEWL